MPNTIKPTTVPQVIAEGPLAVVREVDDILEQPDVSTDPLTAVSAGTSSENLNRLDHPLTNRNPRRGSSLCRKATRSQTSLRKRSYEVPYTWLGQCEGQEASRRFGVNCSLTFQCVFADDARRQNSAVSSASGDEVETPPIPLV